MSSKHMDASRVIALATLCFATAAEAQPYGPGQGGDNIMGWDWGMGGIGGIGFVIIALLFVGFGFYAVRHRNS
jgi:hypothetical protein